MSDNLFILLVVVSFMLGVAVSIAYNYLRSSIGSDKLAAYTEWAKNVVQYAEQVYTKEEWMEKKEYCMTFLTNLIGNALTKDQIDVLVESAVKGLRLAQKAVGDK